jgi:hypothetical protein
MQLSCAAVMALWPSVVTSTVRLLAGGHGTDTVVAKIVELSARTGKLVRVLSTVTRHGVKPGNNAGETGDFEQTCNVIPLGPAGINVLASCYSFGKVDGSGFTPMAGFPSPSSSGISGQSAAAW